MPLSRMIEGEVGCRLLKSFSSHATASAYQSSERQTNAGRLDTRFVRAMWDELRGRICIDFAHGHGNDVIEMGAYGAQRVIGIDAWDKALPISSGRARAAKIDKTCQFLGPTTNLPKDAALPEADVIFPLSALEHYDEPEAIPQKVLGLLKLLGCVMARFGSSLWQRTCSQFLRGCIGFSVQERFTGPGFRLRQGDAVSCGERRLKQHEGLPDSQPRDREYFQLQTICGGAHASPALASQRFYARILHFSGALHVGRQLKTGEGCDACRHNIKTFGGLW